MQQFSVVISGFDLDEFVLGALAAGADGYLVKSEDPQRILAAVRDVHRGAAVLSAAATRTVPAWARCTPAMALTRVDFPEPLGPSRAQNAPEATSKETSSRIRRGP